MLRSTGLEPHDEGAKRSAQIDHVQTAPGRVHPKRVVAGRHIGLRLNPPSLFIVVLSFDRSLFFCFIFFFSFSNLQKIKKCDIFWIWFHVSSDIV